MMLPDISVSILVTAGNVDVSFVQRAAFWKALIVALKHSQFESSGYFGSSHNNTS